MKNRDITLTAYKTVSDDGGLNYPDVPGNYIRNDFYDQFFVLDQYTGRRNTKVQHPLYYTKRLEQVVRGSYTVTRASDGRQQIGTGPMSNLSDCYDLHTDQVATTQSKALDRFFEKWHGSLDVSIDTYQYKQSVKLSKEILQFVRYVRTFNIPKLLKSYKDYNKLRQFEAKMLETRYGPFQSKSGSILRAGILDIRAERRRRKLRSASSLWLGYSYGAKPTLQTIYDTAIELSRNFEPLLKVEGTCTTKVAQNITRPGSFGGFPASVGTTEASIQESFRCKYAGWFKTSANTAQLLSKFTTLNPAGFIWENTPFSFCVDWIIDIGGYLRNIESSYLAESVWGGGYFVQSFKRSKHTVTTLSQADSSGSTVGKAFSHLEERILYRAVLNSPPFPQPPKFDLDFSSLQRALNAASLLGTFMGKH